MERGREERGDPIPDWESEKVATLAVTWHIWERLPN